MPKEDLPILNMSNPLHKRLLTDWVRNLAGVYRVEFTKVRNQRSLNQNAYLWGVVYPCVARGLKAAWGEEYGVTRTHELMKSMFLQVPAVDRRTGEVRALVTRSSTSLDVGECSTFIEHVIAFARDDLGVAVPAAGEYETDEPVDERAGAEVME